MKVVLEIVASLAIPLITLRGRSLRRCLECMLGAVLLFAGLAAFGRVLRVDVDPYLMFVAAGVLFVAIPLGFLAVASEVRWSANRAFMIAALGYAAMIPLELRTPIDGDEPYYLLMTESLVRDHDLDLTNQYKALAHSETGRPDLVPQPGDPRGPHGEQFSRHEPFLPILLMPGYALGGLPGAIGIIALFGALLARSTIRFFEEEGVSDATARALFPLIAFGPPVVFYATRIWPEVPAAFFFLEAVRGVRQRRPPRWVGAIFALVLLKIRFGLLAVVLLARVLRTRRQVAIAAAVVAVPLLVAFLVSGNAMNTHSVRELLPSGPIFYWLGFFGLLLDGAAGLLFQAPLYMLAIVALPLWRAMPAGFRLGMSASVLYMVYLVPRSEWHGGWSPPLRYIVVLMPILALGVAAVWERTNASIRGIVVTWTVMLVVHGAAFPWRLFHLATGENFIGEWLSATWQSDFSRLMPSFIRPNVAAIVATVVLTLALAITTVRAVTTQRWLRLPSAFAPLILAILFLAALMVGRQPADLVEFEDAHVTHTGGQLYPMEWTVARFLYQGGWIVGRGDALAFLAKAGRSTLRYQSDRGVTLSAGTQAFVLPPTGAGYGYTQIAIAHEGRVTLQCLDGSANLDWMRHD
jgi:hypothetical protein